MADYRAQVAEEMIRQIEAGTAPWQKPWQPGVIRARPFNPASGKDYRGINSWWLEMQGRGDPRWLTYRQATALDAQVRKGERGTTVEYWQWTRQVPEVDTDGNEILDDDGKPKLQTVRLDRPRVFFARVFNAEQIDGLAPLVTPEPAFEPVARAEEILAAGGVSITHDQSDRAFYRPSTDRIHLPAKAAFAEAYEYYATALHELGHATGHPSRLARTFGPFGSRDYAVEELRAEMASFLLTTESGLGHYPERHAGYVESWLKVLQDDRNLLFRAARDAETIRSWVLEPERRQALERGAAMENEAAAKPTFEPVIAPSQASEPAMDGAPLPSLAGATVDVRNGMAQVTRDGVTTTLGGPAAAVHWALETGASPADLTAVLTAAGRDQKMPALERLPVPEGQAVTLAGPGHHTGPVVDIGARHALQQAESGLVLHDLAALRFDGASIAALVQAREAGAAVTFEHAPDGTVTLEADRSGLAAWLSAAPAPVPEAAERHYLDVPYPERHAAKAAGARWDKAAKSWYVPEGTDPAAFAKWEKGAEAPAPAPAPAPTAEKAPDKTERVYLAVPYPERHAAKAAGARWDRHRKAWYVGTDADPAAVARWQAKEPAVTTAPAVDPVKEFADALQAQGLVVDGAPVMDGRWHRAAVDGDRKGVQSGSYRGFLDGVPNGQIMNYKTGKEAVKWVATGATVDPTERAQIQAQAAARAVLREAERAAAADRGAQVARGLLRAGKPFEAGTPHPYLQRKGIVPMSRLHLKDDTLLVPMVNAGGAVRNVQSIAADGEKRYVAGAEKVGLYHPIDPDGRLGVGPTIIAEGYATAATLHTATGRPTVVAFDAGNLKAVAEALRAKYPAADLIIAADDDHHLEARNKPNTGIERATAAAELVGARLIRPPLSEAEKAKGRTDFNDLVAERGAEAAHATILQVLDAALSRPPLKPAVGQEQAEEQEKEPPRQELRRHKPRARAAGMAM
ncbi:zincin-like metallopeptidase domain-containing protein [Caenispirillum bisanense]|uniref:Antirestriction protein ArdC n=1 Tax=Caenispirillum bisanense TaxID=414052 RepID=A0A286GSM2_9PROT|nr:zincin-like metallopeptidase domain-containing protein [Caenispirillum bisanense]SOD98567.1 Antirestriction protein ArdC [Caenispirillum bisanense]